MTKVFPTEKELVGVVLDPYLETADVDTSNNFWPARTQPTRFQLFKDEQDDENPMQRERKSRETSSESSR